MMQDAHDLMWGQGPAFSCSYWVTPHRVIAQAISSQPITAETRVKYWVSPCGICGGQSGTGNSFLQYLSFPCHFHSTAFQLQGKMEKTNHLYSIPAQ
jgi:hypothetical protein